MVDLGPLLFILSINGTIYAAYANNMWLFADDTSIFLHKHNINHLLGHARTYSLKLLSISDGSRAISQE